MNRKQKAVEKLVEKGENPDNRHVLLCPQFYNLSKTEFIRVVKSSDCVIRVKSAIFKGFGVGEV